MRISMQDVEIQKTGLMMENNRVNEFTGNK